MNVTKHTIGFVLMLLLSIGCGNGSDSDEGADGPDEVMIDQGIDLGLDEDVIDEAIEVGMYDCDDGQYEDPTTDLQVRENATRAGRADVVAQASGEPFPEDLGLEETAMVVTADFVNHTISVLDLKMLMEPGACRDSALVREVKTSDDIPPPFALEITADGKRAVIAASAEWLALAPLLAGDDAAAVMEMLPPQATGGMILVVDLETGELEAQLPNSGPPMLIALTPDGTRAFTANASAGTMTVVDLEKLEIIDELATGAGAEVVVISPDGKYGIINQAQPGSIRMFETADPRGTISDEVSVQTDSSDIAWIEGRPDTVVVSLSFKNSQGGDYVVLDVSDPKLPVVIEHGPDISGLGILASVPFVVTPIPGTSSMILSASEQLFSEARFSRVDFSTTPSVVEWTVAVPARGITMGIAVDPSGTVGLASIIGEREVIKINLSNGAIESMLWMEQLGPSYIDIR